MKTLAVDRLKELLDYNPMTGLFIWKETRGPTKIGTIAGNLTEWGYLRIQIDQQLYRAHRLAWMYVYGYFPSNELDHIDLCKTNNRIDNLRLSNNSENQQNRKQSRADNKLGLLGVSKVKTSNRYLAQITINKTNIYLGLHKTPEQAHQAYLEAKRKYHPASLL